MSAQNDPQVGERVVLTEHLARPAHQRLPLPEAVGQHGTIIANDGWGLCVVELEDGATVRAWNGVDMVRE